MMSTLAMHRAANTRRHRGIGLIEILITVVILSIGFLAAAMMQVEGLRFSKSAYNASQAYFLANDMADRMRGNVRGVIAGEYNTRSTTDAPEDDPGCKSNSCTSDELANQDIYDWANMLQPDSSSTVAALPSSASITASGSIAESSPSLYTITMTWSEVINGVESAETLILNFATEEFN